MLDLPYLFYYSLAGRSLVTQTVTCSPQTGDRGLHRSNSEEAEHGQPVQLPSTGPQEHPTYNSCLVRVLRGSSGNRKAGSGAVLTTALQIPLKVCF